MTPRRKATQARFWGHEDLPLFTGIPARVQAQEFKPREIIRQYSLLPPPTFDERAAAMRRWRTAQATSKRKRGR
jgi:hypothetical protein